MRKQRNIPAIDLPHEIWKDIQYTKGLYSVSNKGRIRKQWITKSGKEMKVLMNPFSLPITGKQLIGLKVPSGTVKRFVHELVLISFGKKTRKVMIPIHIDCDGSNNKISNLKWIKKEDKRKYKLKCFPLRNKITVTDREHIKKLALTKTKTEIANIYRLSQSTVSRIINESRTDIKKTV